MVKKNLIFILISLFAVGILFTGCGSSNNNSGASAPVVKSDVPDKAAPVKTVPAPNAAPVTNPNTVVDKALDTNTASQNDTVVIGSLI